MTESKAHNWKTKALSIKKSKFQTAPLNFLNRVGGPVSAAKPGLAGLGQAGLDQGGRAGRADWPVPVL